jgi:hypothetical protein|tara:strand:- start:1979 stop:2194 length:216 start_codon:yes stop_codon:yes gene_type:complete
MNPILLDFEKLFATIKNPKNNYNHLNAISKMIDVFEGKYRDNFEISTSLLVQFARVQFKLLEIKLYNFGKH